jgi:hypothetical protein
LATYSAAIAPFAPGRFSTIMGCPEQRSQPLGEQARDEIGGAAGGERDHELDRPVGIILRPRAARCRYGERGGEQGDKPAADDGHGGEE